MRSLVDVEVNVDGENLWERACASVQAGQSLESASAMGIGAGDKHREAAKRTLEYQRSKGRWGPMSQRSVVINVFNHRPTSRKRIQNTH